MEEQPKGVEPAKRLITITPAFLLVVCFAIAIVAGALGYTSGATNTVRPLSQTTPAPSLVTPTGSQLRMRPSGRPPPSTAMNSIYSPSPSSSVSVGSTIVDHTTGEVTFTNALLGYSITLPKSWEVDDSPGVIVGSPGEAVFNPPGEPGIYGFTVPFMNVAVSTDSKTLFPYWTKGDFTKMLADPATSNNGQRLYKIRNLTVDGKDAMQYVSRTLPGDQTDAA